MPPDDAAEKANQQEKEKGPEDAGQGSPGAGPEDQGKGAEGEGKKGNGAKKQELASPKEIGRFGIFLILLNVVLLLILVLLWPDSEALKGKTKPASLAECCGLAVLPMDTRFLLIVIVAGALGSCLHLATSFSDFVGNRKLVRSWMWWYRLRPFVGMTLAVLVYLALRAGFIVMGGGGTDVLNPYGVASLAALSGMFSRQATDKLREVFENFFTVKEPTKREDPLDKKDGKDDKAEAKDDKSKTAGETAKAAEDKPQAQGEAAKPAGVETKPGPPPEK